MELSEIQPVEVANLYGMPASEFRAYLERELHSEQNIMSLPWAILSVVLYALVLLSHEGVNQSNSLISAIDYDIVANANFAFSDPLFMGHKNYEDVNSFADFWSWMNKGFIPLTMQSQHATSESSGLSIGDLSRRDRKRYLWHHLTVGPTKLSQGLADEIRCPNEHVANVYSIKCTTERGIDLEQHPVKIQAEQGSFVEDIPKTRWLYNASQASTLLAQLEAERWLDQRTNHIKVSKMTYNAASDLLLTTHVNFFFGRSGRIWKLLSHEAMRLKPYQDIASYVWDVLFYTQVTLLFVFEAKDLCSATFQSKGHVLQGLKSYAGIWNLVDWLFIIASYIVLGLWIGRAMNVEDVERMVMASGDLEGCPSAACEEYYSALFARVEDAGQFVMHTKVFNAVVPLIIMLRMFKAFSAQPRLALVTETLRKAWTNLAHYLIVFGAIFASYACMGVAFFGRQSSSFATLDRAIPTMFLMMLGGFDFADLEISGRGYAFFFFATFMFLIVLVMLSMLIAIIMDVYVEVKAISKSSESLFLEAKNTVRRGIQNWQKKRISLHKITPVLCVDDNKLLRMEHLLDSSNIYYVPGLSEAQAQRLLSEAARMWSFKHALAVKPGDIKKFVDDTFKALTPFVRFSAVAAKTALSEEDENRDPADRSRSGLMESGSDDETADWDKGPSPEAAGRTEISVDQLAMQVPLQTLLRAAEMKISMGDPRAGLGCRLPSWPGSKELLSQVVSTAQTICSDFLHRAAV